MRAQVPARDFVTWFQRDEERETDSLLIVTFQRDTTIPPPFTNCVSIFFQLKSNENLSILCTILYPEGDVTDFSNPHRFPISICEDSNHQLIRLTRYASFLPHFFNPPEKIFTKWTTV